MGGPVRRPAFLLCLVRLRMIDALGRRPIRLLLSRLANPRTSGPRRPGVLRQVTLLLTQGFLRIFPTLFVPVRHLALL